MTATGILGVGPEAATYQFVGKLRTAENDRRDMALPADIRFQLVKVARRTVGFDVVDLGIDDFQVLL